MSSPVLRQAAVDAGVGAVAFALAAGVLLLQGISMTAVEYLLFLFPAIVFPLAVLLRTRRAGRPLIAFVSIMIWCVAAFMALAWIANTNFAAVAAPLVVCLVSGGIAAVARKSIVVVPAILLLALGIAFAVPSLWSAMLTRHVHVPAPDVALLMRDGSRVPLSRLRGNVIVLNFWGVWCGPCVRELPELDAVARTESSSTPTKFFAVNSGLGGETAAQVDQFLVSRKVAVPPVYDFDRRVYKAFGISALPTTVIIDPAGIERTKRNGFASTANFASWLQRSVREAAGR